MYHLYDVSLSTAAKTTTTSRVGSLRMGLAIAKQTRRPSAHVVRRQAEKCWRHKSRRHKDLAIPTPKRDPQGQGARFFRVHAAIGWQREDPGLAMCVKNPH